MGENNLVYNVTEWQRHLWKYHKLVDQNAQAAEREGVKRYEAFSDFSAEIFHRMFTDKPEKLDSPAPGTEIFQSLHERMDEIPELQNLRQQCCGNEQWSGIGTSAVIDTLMMQLPEPDDQVKDLRSDDEIERLFNEAIQNAESEEEKKALEESLFEQMDPNNVNTVAGRRRVAEEAADSLDSTQVRNALREAAEKASEEIKAQEAMMDALSFGMDPHSGKKARMAAHKKMSEILGQNKRIKEIAKLAGRMRRIALEQQRQKPQRGTDEVAGIELGANLSKIIPAELMLMDDSIEAIFASKYLEQALAQFEMSKTPKKEQGPIVALIDSSGSMAGGPDMWAAAVALAFLEIAYQQKRAFGIVFFGGSVLKTELFSDWSNVDHSKILDTVSFFAADGGTNFEEPLNAGIDLIENTGAFEEADIVMITDGVASVSDSFLSRWSRKKAELVFSCYSILVGSATATATNELFSDEVELLNDVIKSDEGMHKFFKRV